MSLFVTTQSYRNDIPTEYGYLLQIDNNTGKILKKKKIDTPVEGSEVIDRIKPGLRGIFLYDNEIYTASWNKIFILDIVSLEIKRIISHKWMSDIHGLFINKFGIWVTSSLPDALILYDFNGTPLTAIWFSETFLYKNKTCVDKTIDWRKRGKNFYGFNEFHANHITVKDGCVFITGRGRGGKDGRIITIKEKKFLNINSEIKADSINLFACNLHGPHDGIWQYNNVWITETIGSTIACVNKKGKVEKRKKILEYEGERIQYNGLKNFIKFKIKELILKKPGIKITHWTRGLAIDDKFLYVGQSTKAGDNQSRARIVKVDKSKMEIVDCFYLDIENYPETRIFQIHIYPY